MKEIVTVFGLFSLDFSLEMERSSGSAVWVIGLLLGALMVSVSGRFVVEKNSLTVTSPESIRGNHDSAIGNFGIPQYGGSMAGTVVYPKVNRKGCNDFDDSGLPFKAKPGALPTFVLVDRGGNVVTSLLHVVFYTVMCLKISIIHRKDEKRRYQSTRY